MVWIATPLFMDTRVKKSTSPVLLLALAILVSCSPVLPFLQVSGTGYHDGQRIAAALFWVFALTVIVVRLIDTRVEQAAVSSISQKLTLVFSVLGLVAALLSASPRFGLYEWANTVGLFLVAASIAEEIYSAPDSIFDTVLLFTGVSSGLYVFQALVAYAAALINAEQAAPQDLIIGFDNYRFFNHIQTLGLPLLGLLVMRSKQLNPPKYFNLALWFTVLSLYWMLTFVTAGRGTFVGVWAAALLAVALFRQQAKPWFYVMASSCAAGLVAYLFLYVLGPLLCGLQPYGLLIGVAQRTSENLDSSRWALWQLAIELTKANPWFGAGPLHFASYARYQGLAAHPHNLVLQIASEWGLPALFVSLALVTMALTKLIKAGMSVSSSDGKNQAIFTTFFATAIAVCIDSMVSGLLVMPSSQLWVVLWLGCAWGWTAVQLKIGPVGNMQVSRHTAFVVILVTFALVVCFLNGLLPEALDLPAHENKSLELEPNKERSQFNPRIWRAGYF